MAITWIEPEALNRHIGALAERANDAVEEAKNRRVANVVDPFSSLLIAATFSVRDPDQLVKLQDAESGLRGMSNALGGFHQTILASIDGWRDHDSGYDLECPERRILAEIKNKWNTMNMDTRRGVEENLRTAIRQKRGHWNGYLVTMIPKTPDRYERNVSPNVFETDGASFYHTATGDPNALHDLFDHVCDAISPSADVAEHCRAIVAQSLPPRAGT